MIDSKTEQLIRNVIAQNLDTNMYKVFVFGSRASDSHRKFSDIDIGIKGKQKIPGYVMQKIKGAFEESTLPYKVDVVDFSTVSNQFEKVATQDIKPIFMN